MALVFGAGSNALGFDFECSHVLSVFFLLYIFPPDFIGVRQPLNRAPFGLRVNAAVFAFIIYFFRLLFELPALILDQSNKFY